MPAPELLATLMNDGLLELRGGVLRTTRRWQAAMARAAYRLLHDHGDEHYDLRIAMSSALFELCGAGTSDERIAAYVEALLPIEQSELDPRSHL